LRGFADATESTAGVHIVRQLPGFMQRGKVVGMAVSRLRCAGVLLLVVWLTADLAAFGFCGDQFGPTAASTSIGTGHGSNDDTTLPCCRAHHCFCCSSCAEVLKFELAFDTNTAFIPSPLQPRPADISARNTAPPPRF
jgi:hypothetical protein